MTLQNDKNLLKDIQSVGCYFLCLARMIELEAEIEFDAQQINDVWERSKQEGYLNKNNEIVSPDKILKLFSFQTNKSVVVCQIGEEKEEKIVFWQWTKPNYQTANYLVEMLLTFGKHGTHFILCDKEKNVIYDSYSFTKYRSNHSGRYLHYMKIK